MSNRNRGDDYYNKFPDRYTWADEVGWTDEETGEVVESHEGFAEERHRSEDDDFFREEAFRRRNGG